MPAGRVLYAGLRLLDRQLVDRSGRPCGKVDDLELETGADGSVYVSAILTGPGALLERTGHSRLGGWLRRLAPGALPSGTSYAAIPIRRVANIDAQISLSLDVEEVATFGGERWVWDHIVRHIPGSRARADR
jgi:hypothetical protein